MRLSLGLPRPRGARARRHPLLGLVLRRLVVGVALAFVVSLLVFAATNILPGDAASALLGRNATRESLKAVREQLGLNKPLSTLYLDWIGGLFRGDLGKSFAANQPVSALLADRFPNTLVLTLFTVVVMFPLSIALGVLAGIRAGRPLDHVISLVTLGAIALPEFIIGTLLAAVFAVGLGLLPGVSLISGSPFSHPASLVLPVATLCLVAVAYATRMVRAGVIEVMSSEYVQMARLNGIQERRVVVEHALRNSLAPTVQVLALTLQWLVGGVIIVETVFAYPGIGALLVQAVVSRDLPLVQSLALIIALIYIAINILADVIVIVLIPKLRTAQ